VLVNYGVHEEDFLEVEDALKQLGCNRYDIRRSLKVLTRENTGFTFSNSEYKMSIICVGPSSDVSQFVNTSIHEAKHVQSHICSYYGIPEDSEDAAYLIGYLVQRMYKMFSKIIRQYV
jgi:threonyl-tRNA synthetase